jgi:hypothetical protein
MTEAKAWEYEQNVSSERWPVAIPVGAPGMRIQCEV